MFLHKNSVWKVLQSDASRAEHLGSSTANGFSATLASGSIRRVCVTAFQLVHFQIAYHSSWWSYITQSYEMGLPLMVTFQYSNRKELKTADSSGLQQHIVWQCMGETLATLTQPKCNVKDVALVSWLFVVALMLITGSALHLFYVLVI